MKYSARPLYVQKIQRTVPFEEMRAECVPVRFKEVKQLACFIDGVVMYSDSFAKCEYGRILKQLLSCSTAFY